MCLFSLSSCLKDRRPTRDACINVDKNTAAVAETITISNCGSELPAQYVSPTIDWGDGTETTGQTGTHSYSTSGSYTISLMLNGDLASNVLDDADESKVKHVITVQ